MASIARASERMLAAALEAEVAAYIDRYVGEVDEDGRRLVVVLMKGDGPLWDQAVSLLDWGFAQPR